MTAPTGNTAKDQVRIRERIWQARQGFYRQYAEPPKVLYIGQEDFYDLRRECEPWEYRLTDDRDSFAGMLIFRVDTARHLNVAKQAVQT